MYRHEGWKNPYSVLPEHMEREYPVPSEWVAYEAGADAILKAVNEKLRPLGIQFTSEGMMHNNMEKM